MLLLVVLLSVVLATVVSGGPLDRRAPCSCPEFDLGFFPLSPSSDTVGSVLRCYYPYLSRCLYSTVSRPSRALNGVVETANVWQSDGSLLQDRNNGFCRMSATGRTCPSTDLAAYTLGPGSGVHGVILYCTYPTPSERSSTRFYCDYSVSTSGIAQSITILRIL